MDGTIWPPGVRTAEIVLSIDMGPPERLAMRRISPWRMLVLGRFQGGGVAAI